MVQGKSKDRNYSLDIKKVDIKALSTYLSSKRDFPLKIAEKSSIAGE